MSIINNDLLLGSGDEGYNLTRSLRFRKSATAYLSRTPSATTSGSFTISTWVKRGALDGTTQTIQGSSPAGGVDFWIIYFNSSNAIIFEAYNAGSNLRFQLITSQVFRDPSAWYHIVASYDLTTAKLYVNGTQVTAFSTNTQNGGSLNNAVNGQETYIGLYRPSAALNFDGYQTEINYVTGQALTPSSFGSTNTLTGVWQPARYTGTYGTNGFYLPFTDNSALTTSSNVGLGKDFSGNGNYWTTNNISITSGTTYDSMTDVPTLTSATAANYCVMNPLQLNSVTLSNGNLTYLAGTNGSLNYPCGSTLGVSSGKFYWEITVTSLTLYLGVGIASTTDIATLVQNNLPIGFSSASYSVFQDGNKCNNSSTSAYQTGGYTTGDVIGVAFDATNGKIWFSKNNTFPNSGDPVAGTNAAFSSISANTYLPALSGNNSTLNANFGQRPFTYTPPTGYVALNTYNLPTSTIVKGNTVMDATLWSGSGSSQTITNAAAFKPDFVWAKARNNTSGVGHMLADSVRGGTNVLHSDSTSAEQNNLYGAISSFNSNGFTTASGSVNSAEVHQSGFNYVGWQWQAGQGTTSTNTSGSITSTVSVNASAGFSVVTYTGTGVNATVGHGLGVAPSMIVTKSRTNSSLYPSWNIYHKSIGAGNVIYFNSTSGAQSTTAMWNNTDPTSSVFSVGTDIYGANLSAAPYVAYCWTPIAGYSAFGSLTGNGSTDGPMVYTGFQPRFILFKNASGVADWGIYDTARSTYNVVNSQLDPNGSAAEYTSARDIDILSNGFKIRSSNGGINTNGSTYIYAAFAANPFKNSLAR